MSAIAIAAPDAVCSLDFRQIRGILAQRFPFLMLDKVSSLEPGRRVVAIKNVTGNEAHFVGHFPHLAVMPGVLIIEAMAQALHILFAVTRDPQSRDSHAALNYLANANVSFLKPVFPGDQLQIEATIVKQLEQGVVGDTMARVDGLVVAKGQVTLLSKKDGGEWKTMAV